MMTFLLYFAVICTITSPVFTQQIETQPKAIPKKDCICNASDEMCYCTLVVEHKVTMVLEKEQELVYPDNGELKFATGEKKDQKLTEEQKQRVITGDGYGSRLVITVNGVFPGPRIETFENQKLQITVVNTLHTDSVSVHFHGMFQKGTAHVDGVAFVTQCPVLPGQTFVHTFTAYPPGTAFYHAHIGDQRSMGLYGPFIVRRAITVPNSIPFSKEIIITLQDWNHLMDAATAYQRMLTGQFDLVARKKIETTESLDGAKFGRFEFHSGLVNGKGRYYDTTTHTNASPLERFSIKEGETYRFRIIGAATLYPMRIYIEGQKFEVYGSDGFNLNFGNKTSIESVIIHPGERYDIIWKAPAVAMKKEILLVAETLETPSSLKHSKYHAAEAVLEFVNHQGSPNPNPENKRTETCTPADNCIVFNCPFLFYPPQSRKCLTYNDVKNNDPIKDPESVLHKKVEIEKFLNFGFPGPGPASVNGRQFVFPPSAYLTDPNLLNRKCEDHCTDDGLCQCTHVEELEHNKLVQFVFTNIGNGAFASHPIHLHGHSFYVMKMGFGTYNQTSGLLLKATEDINCTGPHNYCSTMKWTNSSWSNGNIPDLNDDPPQKDTIILPTGSYVVIRFLSNNPGAWFLHCHIDFHNTNGMALIVNEAPQQHPPWPSEFPACHNFYGNGTTLGGDQTCGAIEYEGNIIYLATFVIFSIISSPN